MSPEELAKLAAAAWFEFRTKATKNIDKPSRRPSDVNVLSELMQGINVAESDEGVNRTGSGSAKAQKGIQRSTIAKPKHGTGRMKISKEDAKQRSDDARQGQKFIQRLMNNKESMGIRDTQAHPFFGERPLDLRFSTME
jgi:hypothetical protein